MNKMQKLVIGALGVSLLAGCQGDYFHSNRCVTRDTNHTFTKATLLMSGTNVEVQVVGWMDYQNSDSIQLWVRDSNAKTGCRVVYTHLTNVILENPDPENLPKFNKVW